MVDWEFLGIEPTTDTKKIKRAYAQKLKIHHPEDDPEGYQHLREAFDQAKKYAKNMKQRVVNNHIQDHTDEEVLEDVPDEGATLEVEWDHEDLDSIWDESPVIHTEQVKIAEFMANVEQLYADFPARIDRANWEKLLDADIVWDMGAHDILSYRLTDFLEEHCQLPKEIWLLLDHHFNWKEKHPSFYQAYIKHCPNLPYQTLVKKTEIERDAFLFHRDQFFRSLVLNELDEAKMAMEKARAIFAKDADLLRLQVEYYRRVEDYEAAIKVIATYLQINPDDCDMRLKQVTLLVEINEFDDARSMCEQLEKEDPENLQVLRLLGTCLYKQGEMKRSRDVFKRVLQKDSLDAVSQTYLAKATARLDKKGSSVKTKQEMKHEMGVIGIKEKYRMFLSRMPKLRYIFIVFLFIIVLHDMVNEAFIQYTDVGPVDFFKQAVQPAETVLVDSYEDFPETDNPNQVVSLIVEDAFHTGYYASEYRNEYGQIITEGYYPISDLVSPEEQMEDDTKMVWIGYMEDGTPITFLLPYWKSSGNDELETVNIAGKWESTPISELGFKLEDSLEIHIELPDNLVVNKVVNTIDIKNPNTSLFNLPLDAYFFLIVLVVLYFFVIRLIVKSLLILRY